MSFFKKTSSSPPDDDSNTTVSGDTHPAPVNDDNDNDNENDLEARNVDDRTGHFRIGAGRKGRCDMCTEELGFESSTEKTMDGGDHDLTMESLSSSSSSSSSSLLRSRSRMTMCGAVREKTNLKDFPPLLSTLDESGRPRFDLNKVRRSGRLEIKMVRNNKPGVVRVRGREGEVRMEMVKHDQEEQEEEEDREVGEEEENEDSEVGEEEEEEREGM